MFFGGSDILLMMLIVLLVMIAIGIFIVAPVSAKYDAYNNILKDSGKETEKNRRVACSLLLAFVNSHISWLELVDYGLGHNLDCLACGWRPFRGTGWINGIIG